VRADVPFDNLPWIASKLAYDGDVLDARVCIFESADTCDEVLEGNWHNIAESGGALFLYARKSNPQRVRTDGVPGFGIRYLTPPSSELWHVPSCEFSRLFGFTRCFGFPGVLPDNFDTFAKAQELVMAVHNKRYLGVFQIDKTFALLRFVNPENTVSEEEAQQIIEFNKHHFFSRDSSCNDNDKIRNWIEKGFFSVGIL
jgi:hypothetical protein